MKPFVYDATGIDPLQAFAAVKHMPYSLFLDSSDRKHVNSRYSFVLCYPIETIEAKSDKITVTNWEQKLSFNGDPLKILESRIKSWVSDTTHIPNMPPFQGGAAGLFGYDLARYYETLPETAKQDSTIPEMAVGIYDQVLAHDHLLKKTYLFTHARNEKEAEHKRSFLLKLYQRDVDIPAYAPSQLDWTSNFDQTSYEALVQRVVDYIYDGDIFQANIAQRFEANLPETFDPFVHYVHLRDVNPAPFSSYMNLGDIKISSASPERFITVNEQGDVETCPIKGTRPRAETLSQDRANKNALQDSEKDKAENTMIVDLLRNDLSKVCKPHSVNVPDLCKLESFSNVHHLVSKICAQLEDDKTSIDLLRSSFPGGSITGAPKIRAMEIIEELEPTRRGAYCGSIGYIGFDGVMDTNILIRTLTYENNRVTLQAGGGIVAQSNPQSEYQETLDKASAILTSFQTPSTRDTKHYA